MKKGQHFNWSGQERAIPVSVLYCNIVQYNTLRFIGLPDKTGQSQSTHYQRVIVILGFSVNSKTFLSAFTNLSFTKSRTFFNYHPFCVLMIMARQLIFCKVSLSQFQEDKNYVKKSIEFCKSIRKQRLHFLTSMEEMHHQITIPHIRNF